MGAFPEPAGGTCLAASAVDPGGSGVRESVRTFARWIRGRRAVRSGEAPKRPIEISDVFDDHVEHEIEIPVVLEEKRR